MQRWLMPLSAAFLIVANAADALLTDLGLRTGSIKEANPLMAGLYGMSPALFLLVKLALPLLLLPLLYRVSAGASAAWIGKLLAGACAVYLIILGVHGVWLVDRFSPT